jgi:hypothetical protein
MKIVVIGNGMGEPGAVVERSFTPANARPWMAGPGLVSWRSAAPRMAGTLYATGGASCA